VRTSFTINDTRICLAIFPGLCFVVVVAN